MNTLFHFFDAALQYNRGKQTGLWGLIGIGLAILIVAMWSDIQPIFDKIGLVDFFKSLGLVHADAHYMTAFKIFMFIFFACILFMLFGIILMGIFAGVMSLFIGITSLSEDNWLYHPLVTIFLVLLLPFIILFVFYQKIKGVLLNFYKFITKNTKKQQRIRQNEAYFEMIRNLKIKE